MNIRIDPFFARIFTVTVVMGLAAAVYGAPWSITNPAESKTFKKDDTITGDGDGPSGKWCKVRLWSGLTKIAGPSEQKVVMTVWEQADDWSPPAGGWTQGDFLEYDLWSIEDDGSLAFRDKHTLFILED